MALTKGSPQKVFTVTDSTDIALAAQGASPSNVGAAFNMFIPASGLIRFAGFAGRLLNNGAAGVHICSFGLKVNGVIYWFDQYSDNGTASYYGQFYTKTAASQYQEFNGAVSAAQSSSVASSPYPTDFRLDIAALGIATGSQSVQLVAGYQANQSTLKGTVKTTRVTLEIVS